MRGWMNDDISISVVIPAWNAEETLARALESVLAQTRPPDEIIVVDDASTDGTVRLAKSYADQGVSFLSLRERRGAAAARNTGIRGAKGRWIAFLDADDEWLPTKLEKQAAAISANPKHRSSFVPRRNSRPTGSRWVIPFAAGLSPLAARLGRPFWPATSWRRRRWLRAAHFLLQLGRLRRNPQSGRRSGHVDQARADRTPRSMCLKALRTSTSSPAVSRLGTLPISTLIRCR